MNNARTSSYQTFRVWAQQRTAGLEVLRSANDAGACLSYDVTLRVWSHRPVAQAQVFAVWGDECPYAWSAEPVRFEAL